MTRLLNTFSKFHFSTLELEGNAKEKNETNRQGEKREGKNGDDEFAFAIPDWGTTTSIKEVRGIISGLNVIYNTRYVNLGVLAVDSVFIPSLSHLESLNEPIVRWIKTLIRRHTIDHGIRHRLPSRYRPREHASIPLNLHVAFQEEFLSRVSSRRAILQSRWNFGNSFSRCNLVYSLLLYVYCVYLCKILERIYISSTMRIVDRFVLTFLTSFFSRV